MIGANTTRHLAQPYYHGAYHDVADISPEARTARNIAKRVHLAVGSCRSLHTYHNNNLVISLGERIIRLIKILDPLAGYT